MNESKKYPPAYWALRKGVMIMDPDGWRFEQKNGLMPKDFDEPVTEAEFNERLMFSTIAPYDHHNSGREHSEPRTRPQSHNGG